MSSSTTLPDFSVLAAKAPQRPVENLPSRPSTSNYASALATAQQAQLHSSTASSNATSGPKEDNNSSSTGTEETEEGGKPTSAASWRPNHNRQQSWSPQDYKRAMQTPLMSPSLEKKTEYGFSSKDEQETASADSTGSASHGEES